MSPLHNFQCENASCAFEQEELHRHDETSIACPLCGSSCKIIPIGRLADYTGANSLAVQYVTRRAPESQRDSFITKLGTRDRTELISKQVGKQIVGAD